MQFIKILFFFIVWVTVTIVSADESGTPIEGIESDQALMDELMEIVEESTEIVTQNRMNINSVPGMMTVLYGTEMEELGKRTVWDALSLVPNIFPTLDQNGGTSVVARGLSFPFSSGNVKIMVNSLSMVRESTTLNNAILQIPIEQVERIEVVRGPSAIFYGDNAFMGLINIITKKQSQRLFTRLEGNGAASGGGYGSYIDTENELQVHANLYAYGNDSADAPNGVFAEEDRQFGVLSLHYKGLSVSAQTFHRNYEPENRVPVTEGNSNFAVQQLIEFTPEFSTQLSFSYLLNDFRTNRSTFDGDKFEGGIDFHWTGWKNHKWWFRFVYINERIDQTETILALPPRPGPPPPGVNPPPGAGLPPGVRPPPGTRPPPQQANQIELELSGINREYYSFSLQDQFEITENVTLTGSLRFDHRGDLDKDFFTPRIAAVWRITDEHILKAQYAQGFRAPGFFELFKPSGEKREIIPETISTTELAYIFSRPNMTGSVVIFYSHVDDMIFINADGFGNLAEAESMGFELEWKQQLFPFLDWQANLSFVDSWSTRSLSGAKAKDPVSPTWLSNIAVNYRPIDTIIFTALWNYIGERNNSEIDVQPTHNLDFTLTASDVAIKGFDIRLGIQNVLQSEQVYLTSGPGPTRIQDYGDKALIWTQLSYRF